MTHPLLTAAAHVAETINSVVGLAIGFGLGAAILRTILFTEDCRLRSPYEVLLFFAQPRERIPGDW